MSDKTNDSELLYHVSCDKCGHLWWDKTGFPKVCPACHEYPYYDDLHKYSYNDIRKSQELSKLKRVIKGLDCCTSGGGCVKNKCPYLEYKDNEFCKVKVDSDALEILMEYQKEKERNPVIVCPHCGGRVK